MEYGYQLKQIGQIHDTVKENKKKQKQKQKNKKKQKKTLKIM